MEKIYMEENQNNQNRGKVNFTIALSLFVAIAAIVSLVGVGFNQISYAAETPTGVDEAPSGLTSFTFANKLNNDGAPYFVGLTDGSSTFNVPIYYRKEDGKPIFCVQHDIDPGYDGTYNKLTKNETDLSEEEMRGVLYILRQSKSAFDNAPGISGKTGIIEDAATQVAIWAYLYDKTNGRGPNTLVVNSAAGSDDVCNNGPACRNVIKNFSAYEDNNLPPLIDSVAGLNTKIQNVVDAALRYNGVDSRLVVASENTKSFTKTDDGKYYKSAKITVSAAETIKKLVASVDGPEGTKLVDKDNKELYEFADVSAAKEFYVLVPVEKVTETKQNIRVNFNGTFEGNLTGTYFGISGKQTVVTVTETELTTDSPITLEITGTPNTGMSSVQTIYFIGLVVLLCGIGIIYANAKPVEEK